MSNGRKDRDQRDAVSRLYTYENLNLLNCGNSNMNHKNIVKCKRGHKMGKRQIRIICYADNENDLQILLFELLVISFP